MDWEGTLAPTQTGTYTFQTYSNDGIKFWIDGRLVMNHWRQSWLPSDDVARVRLQANHRSHLRLEWTRDQGEAPYREMWQFGGDDSPTYGAELKFDRLRYRLLPYIYSLAGPGRVRLLCACSKRLGCPKR